MTLMRSIRHVRRVELARMDKQEVVNFAVLLMEAFALSSSATTQFGQEARRMSGGHVAMSDVESGPQPICLRYDDPPPFTASKPANGYGVHTPSGQGNGITATAVTGYITKIQNENDHHHPGTIKYTSIKQCIHVCNAFE